MMLHWGGYRLSVKQPIGVVVERLPQPFQFKPIGLTLIGELGYGLALLTILSGEALVFGLYSVNPVFQHQIVVAKLDVALSLDLLILISGILVLQITPFLLAQLLLLIFDNPSHFYNLIYSIDGRSWGAKSR